MISDDIPKTIPTIYARKKDKPKERKAIDALHELLTLERKSWSTIKTYKTHLIGLLRYYPNAKPSQITNQQLKKYLFQKIEHDKIAETTQGQILNAFVAFYKRLLKQEEKLVGLKRPKKPKKLPNILSKEAVTKLFKSTNNIKHKTLLMLVYSAGLRKREVINLRKRDIFFDRKCIFVKAGKGKKDRYIFLSQKAEKYLKEY